MNDTTNLASELRADPKCACHPNSMGKDMTKARYTTSRRWLARAERVIPGAHHLSGRVLTTPERSPMYIERGRGCRITDVDGNEYIDSSAVSSTLVETGVLSK
jgi:4-aminobutyrate aminotransferase-like enzyme